MLFNSFEFSVFLPIVFILYWFGPKKLRRYVMLVASLYFYMSWNPKYVVLLLFAAGISYSSAIALKKTQHKKLILLLALMIIFGILVVFKYSNFILDNLVAVFSMFSIKLSPYTMKFILPMGISFYTFQTVSYVIDVYKEKVEPEYNFITYLTFISFFPQLVAGPIERTIDLLPQLKTDRKFNEELAVDGVKIMLVGFYKKLVLADFFGIYVDRIYNNLYGNEGFAYLCAAVFFAIQIYCDFSGYSDIAVGTAKLFSINLTNNFKSPYLSDSLKDFWRRWHISLSSWFRDYVYIPLGGKQKHKSLNLLITFSLSGLWHGASWNYIIWGLIHGCGQVIENVVNKINILKRIKIGRLISIILTLVFVIFAWIFFRIENISEAIYCIVHMLDGISHISAYFIKGYNDMQLNVYIIIKMIVILIPLIIYDIVDRSKDAIIVSNKLSKMKQFCIWVGVLFLIVLFSMKGVAAEFIYFQF